MNKNDCKCSNFRENTNFNSYDDFSNFNIKIDKTDFLIEITVKSQYSNVGLEERWFKCSNCNKIWCLVEPDPPFKGIWDEIK